MIHQQYYTRERKNIFTNTPGNGTVAITKGLDEEIVKNVIESFCRYEIPPLTPEQSLDPSYYPEVYYYYFSAKYKVMVAGTAFYKEKDFTGERSTYFCHNFVLPMEEAEKFMSGPCPGLLSKRAFQSAYNPDNGIYLNSVELSHIMGQDGPDGPEANVSQDGMKKLLFALIHSFTSQRKIFLALDLEAKDLPDAGSAVMSRLLKSLPPALRMKTGFLSYSVKPETYKNISLAVVDKKNLSPYSKAASGDFVFIIDKDGEYSNVDKKEYSPYEDFMDFLCRGPEEERESFFRFAGGIMETSQTPSLSVLMEMYHIFLYWQGKEEENGEYYLTLLLKYFGEQKKNGALEESFWESAVFALLKRLYSNVVVPSEAVLDLISGNYPYMAAQGDMLVFFLKVLSLCLKEGRNGLAEKYLFGGGPLSGDIRRAVARNGERGGDLFDFYFEGHFADVDHKNLAGKILSALELNPDLRPRDLEPFYLDKMKTMLGRMSLDEILAFEGALSRSLGKEEDFYRNLYKNGMIPAMINGIEGNRPPATRFELEKLARLAEGHHDITASLTVRTAMEAERIFQAEERGSLRLGRSFPYEQTQSLNVLDWVERIVVKERIKSMPLICLCAMKDGLVNYDKAIHMLNSFREASSVRFAIEFYGWMIRNKKDEGENPDFYRSVEDFLKNNWDSFTGDKRLYEEMADALEIWLPFSELWEDMVDQNTPKWEKNAMAMGITKESIILFASMFVAVSAVVCVALYGILRNADGTLLTWVITGEGVTAIGLIIACRLQGKRIQPDNPDSGNAWGKQYSGGKTKGYRQEYYESVKNIQAKETEIKVPRPNNREDEPGRFRETVMDEWGNPQKNKPKGKGQRGNHR